MYKFVIVLIAFIGASSAAPGYLHESHGYPAAVSHSSRVDVFSKPIVTPILEQHDHHYGSLPLGYHSGPAVSHSAHFSVHPPPHSYSHGGYGGFGGDYGYGGGFEDIHGIHSY